MIALLLLGAGLILVVAGAELFFKALLAASARLRTAPFVVTALVSGFEVENLAAGIAANAKGLPGAAAGTFLGGTTFLALGVAGFAALVSPLVSDLPRASVVWAAASPAVLLLTSLDGTISRIDGGLLLAWFAVVMAAIVRTGRHLAAEKRGVPLKRPVLRLIGGLAILGVGGELLGEGIRAGVSRFSVPPSLLGNTVVAASVEAEELVRVAVPAKRGRADVALGNIIGTIAHFVAFNAGVIALIRPVALDDVSLYLHMPVAVASVVLVSALVLWRERLGRLEGTLLIACYLVYLGVAIATWVGS